MREELVRADPNQGICISLEDINNDNKMENLFQWKCSCWSIKDEFLIEWNINVPNDLIKKMSLNNSLNISQISFVKYKDMLYVIISWSEKYIWIYCHDIMKFSDMSSQGINISIEPKIFDLDLENITDNDSINENHSEFKISLPINTGESEFQFVISSTISKLHTLKLIVSSDIAQILNISLSSNWWDIATFNEVISDNEISNYKNDENISEKRSYSHIRALIDIFSWKNENNKRNNNDLKNYSNSNIIDQSDKDLTNFSIQKKINQKKLTMSKFNENILIISFPSIYSKWNVSFLCFIVGEKTLINNCVKTLFLFRHDSFGVLEYCWSIDFDEINNFQPLNLIAVPHYKQNLSRNIKSISTNQIDLSYSSGKSQIFSLFFIYKFKSHIKFLQLTQSNNSNINNENNHLLLNWTIKPNINKNLIYKIFDLNYSNETNIDIYNIEQNFFVNPNSDININSNNSIQNSFECILHNSKQIYLLSIINNGQNIVSYNIIDHSNQNNKVYFTTYYQNIIYLLVNYQDVPLKIDLNNSNNSFVEYLNIDGNLTREQKFDNSISFNNYTEFNQLISNYQIYRKGERNSSNNKSKLSYILSNNSNYIDAELINDSLNIILEQIMLNFENKTSNQKIILNKIKYINILKIIGYKINLLFSESEDYSQLLNLWGKCSILLDRDYWKSTDSERKIDEHFEGSSFDQITNEYPKLRSLLLEILDINSFI